MDGFTEKKWFVYLGDHHEGPFSLEDIQTRMNHGQLSTTNYVWAEGMPDWQPMSEIQAFESVLLPPAPPPGSVESVPAFTSGPELSPVLAAAGPTSGFAAVSLEPASHTTFESGPALTAAHAEPFTLTEAEPALHAEHEDGSTSPDLLAQPNHKKALATSMIKMLMVFAVLGGLGIAYTSGFFAPLMNSQTMKSATASVSNLLDPVLQAVGISPLPKLDDVDADEYEGLKAAAGAKLDAGAQIAIALSKGDLISPTIYVASNLPDGSILDLYIEGIPDSLLSQLSFNAKTQVTINKKFGKSEGFQFPAGAKAFTRGQYTIYVVDPETQPATAKPILARMSSVATPIASVSVPKGLRVIATKSYFLGGMKDSVYTQRLQEFHQKVTAKAQAEIMELRQFAGIMDSKLDETTKKFSSLRKGRRVGPAQKKAWAAYNDQWSKLYAQFGQTFSKLTPEALQNDYFYGFLYQMCQQTGEALNHLHDLQNQYFTGTVDPKAFDIQLGEVNSIARSAIDGLKSRIEQVANVPPSPNGLPRRDAT